MCGFVGWVTFDGKTVDPHVVRRMTDSIIHRGPDDDGYYMDAAVAFGFRRLAILDLSAAGHQPMQTPDGRFTIVFNGEIYNYIELRQELEAHGYEFQSHGDTEVLLAAYHKWGPSCLHRLNGMWAFLIHDKAEQTIFGARDRFGKKPLYYHRHDREILFASEIKAILLSGVYEFAPNWDVLAAFSLLNDYAASDGREATCFAGIMQLPAGSSFVVSRDGSMRISRYWDLDAIAEGDDASTPEQFAHLLEDSVRLRLRADVPSGVLLSGGLDSTSIICTMRKLLDDSGAQERSIDAFSYIAPDFDESSYIAETISRTGARLHRVNMNGGPDFSDLPRLLWFYDQPVHSTTPLVGYALMRLARAAGVIVLLNGQGADEMLGGYSTYFQQRWYSELRVGRIRGALAEIAAFSAGHERDYLSLLLTTLRAFVQHQFRRAAIYRRLSHYRLLQRTKTDSWYRGPLLEHLPSESAPFQEQTLRQSLQNSVQFNPLPLYLRVEDRNSMANSVEARLPFLDYRLVEFAFGRSAQWKLSGPWNKFMLREAMRDRIPELVRTRVDKMGFPTQFHDWFAGTWYDSIMDLLHDQATRERGIFNTATLERDLVRHKRGEMLISHSLFQVIQIELWLRNQRDYGYSAAASGAMPRPD